MTTSDQDATEVIERADCAPAQVRVSLVANLTGISIGVEFGPSAQDPLNQRGHRFFAPTLEQAICDLPALVRMAVNNETRHAQRPLTI